MNRTKKEIVCNHIKWIICLNVFFLPAVSLRKVKSKKEKGL